MTVGMVSWACESGAWQTSDCATTPGSTFTHPVTVKLYDPADIANPIVTVQQDVAVPYRPSADESCGTGWLSDDLGCVNGYLFEAEFDLGGVEVHGEVIASVAFDTQTYGEAPLGVSGPYNALNVGAVVNFSGSNVDPDTVYVNGSLESGWDGYTPAISLNIGSTPFTVENCKAGPETFGFKNVGQCVASVRASN
jgi:hypothetical protein